MNPYNCKTPHKSNNKIIIIAEAGVNHNGSINIAHDMIDAAKEAGADCIKFQVFKTDLLVRREAPTASYQRQKTGIQEQRKLLKALELRPDEIISLKEHCDKVGIEFLATPFDRESVRLLAPLVSRFKVGSGDITNFQLLKMIAQYNMPIILSTGMATFVEIDAAIQWLSQFVDTSKLSLLHCVSLYPTNPQFVNLKVINTLQRLFNLTVGFSDHTVGIHIAIAAASIGAQIIEKHFTLDKSWDGPDHSASCTPRELREMIKAIRDVEIALGDGRKRISEQELEVKKAVRRGLVTVKEIRRGETITEEHIVALRPEHGISPIYYDDVIGAKAIDDIPPGIPLEWWMLSK